MKHYRLLIYSHSGQIELYQCSARMIVCYTVEQYGENIRCNIEMLPNHFI